MRVLIFFTILVIITITQIIIYNQNSNEDIKNLIPLNSLAIFPNNPQIRHPFHKGSVHMLPFNAQKEFFYINKEIYE